MTFDCPFCNWESDDFDETDEHFTEHVCEYQHEQEIEFGEYSK